VEVVMRSPDPNVDVDAVRPEAEFTRFFEIEHAAQVRRAALMLGELTVAEDVVHDAFAAVWQRWPGLSDPGSYLNRCVLNGCRDAASGRARSRRRLERMINSHREGTEPVEVLADVLARLPFRQRCAVVLHYYGGLTNAEIAEAMQCSLGSIGPWIQRGKAQLRKELT
jgi:RNA polymerase sigma-70 factor (ECF subfamily)